MDIICMLSSQKKKKIDDSFIKILVSNYSLSLLLRINFSIHQSKDIIVGMRMNGVENERKLKMSNGLTEAHVNWQIIDVFFVKTAHCLYCRCVPNRSKSCVYSLIEYISIVCRNDKMALFISEYVNSGRLNTFVLMNLCIVSPLCSFFLFCKC